MKRKKSSPLQDFFGMAAVPTELFRAGDVEKILGIEKWRLQKFLSSSRYQLSASGQLGQGQGSWRVFRREEIYRIGIASFLARRGFSPKFVSKVLQFIEDSDMVSFDANGRERPPIIAFVDGPKEPRFEVLSPSDARSAKHDERYHILDVGLIVQGIDRRIQEGQQQEKK